MNIFFNTTTQLNKMAAEDKNEIDEKFKYLSLFNNTSINPIYSLVDLINTEHKSLQPEFEQHIAEFIKTHNLYDKVQMYDCHNTVNDIRKSIQFNLIEHQVKYIYNAIKKLYKFILYAHGENQFTNQYTPFDILDLDESIYKDEFTKSSLRELIDIIRYAYVSGDNYSACNPLVTKRLFCMATNCVIHTNSIVINFKVRSYNDHKEVLVMDDIFRDKFDSICDSNLYDIGGEFFRFYLPKS